MRRDWSLSIKLCAQRTDSRSGIRPEGPARIDVAKSAYHHLSQVATSSRVKNLSRTPSNPRRGTQSGRARLTCCNHSEVPHMHGGVIELFGDCWSWCIWQKGIVGYQSCCVGLRWYNTTHHGVSDPIFDGL